MATIQTATEITATALPRKRFSRVGFGAAVFATLFLALGVMLFVVFTDGFKTAPNLALTGFVAVPLVATTAGWSYFITGRRRDGWITALLFAMFGVPMVVLGIIETINPPEQHEMITLQVGFNMLGALSLPYVVFSLALIRELRK